MNHPAALNIRIALFAGYLLCFVALNLIAFLISLFYRKKLHHPSPRFGFIAAIVLAGAYCLSWIGIRSSSASVRGIELLFLGAGALISISSTIRLFLTMRRVQK
jgi:hypothetical protein